MIEEREVDQVSSRKMKLDKIRQLQGCLYPNGVSMPQDLSQVGDRYGQASGEQLEAEAPRVVVAGRIVFIRDFGKGAFFRCRDATGELQVFLSKKDTTPEVFELGKLLDLGDLVHVTGTVFRTKKGELTVRIEKLLVLAKCQRPLPEKYHGLSDIELRYRKRYLDLITNPETFQTMKRRSLLTALVRRFFEARDFLEVETPMMQTIASGALAKPFVTHHNALDLDLYLRVAPELYLKRLMVGGFPRLFEINRCFRNEGISTQHNPEFTQIEFYQAYATYQDFMALIEALLVEVCQRLHGRDSLVFREQTLKFRAPFARLHIFESLAQRVGVAVDDLFNPQITRRIAQEHHVPVAGFQTPAEISVAVFEALFEEELIQPTFVWGYPVEVSPLARRSNNDSKFVDRFELFVGGMEVANAFSELNDPQDQLERFETQQHARGEGNEEALPIDLDYVEALSYGMPPAAGAGIGMDRLAMVVLDQPSIRDVILFPTLKP